MRAYGFRSPWHHGDIHGWSRKSRALVVIVLFLFFNFIYFIFFFNLLPLKVKILCVMLHGQSTVIPYLPSQNFETLLLLKMFL